MRSGDWIGRNLTIQGYCLTDAERRELWLGVGFAAGFTSRHPFDYVWNHAVRHLFGAPPLPPNPPRRRHGFKLATAWLLAVGTLLAAGATTAALVLRALLVVACTTVTAANLCLPSEALALWDRHVVKKDTVVA